jgi:hypothetical protein
MARPHQLPFVTRRISPHPPREILCALPTRLRSRKAESQRAAGANSGVAPVRWTVNCFRDRHHTLSEGGTEIAPPVSIVDPEGTVRSLVPRDRSYIMGER